MIITNLETWGKLLYDTTSHQFSYNIESDISEQPYVTKPIVLNCYLTYKCNMDCIHCVAKDMETVNDTGIIVTDSLIERINKSPFMVVVITGGEPLLPECESRLIDFVDGMRNKGIVIDTNGLIMPSSRLLKYLVNKNILLRISLDSSVPKHESNLRVLPNDKNKRKSKSAYYRKIDILEELIKNNVRVSIQSVLYKKNIDSIFNLMDYIKDRNINSWYIQRLIPTYKLKPTGKRGKDEPFFLEAEVYEDIIAKLKSLSKECSVECITKKDRRHNCVFIMINSGLIYTTSDTGYQRVFIGKIGEINNYFELVSASEHSVRYYCNREEVI